MSQPHLPKPHLRPLQGGYWVCECRIEPRPSEFPWEARWMLDVCAYAAATPRAAYEGNMNARQSDKGSQ